MLHHSNELYYRERVPLRLGTVRLDAGPSLLAHLHGDCAAAPSRVRVRAHLDKSGQAVLIALPPEDTANMADDPMLREMTSDPKFRKVLVTDGKSAVGQAIAKALIEAGADIVWVGVAEPWKQAPGLDALKSMGPIEIVPLDLTDEKSVRDLAGVIGGKVDILINTAEFHRAHGIADRGTETARAEMEVNYLGLCASPRHSARRCARAPPKARYRRPPGSICCRSTRSPRCPRTARSRPRRRRPSRCRKICAPRCATRASASSMSFPARSTTNGISSCRRRSSAPTALAKAIVSALRDGVEDIYPGDVAQDIFTRWRESQKVLEREMWDQ